MNLAHRTAPLVLLTAVSLAACGGSSGTPPGAAKAGGTPAAERIVLTLANHEDGPRDLGEFVAAVDRVSHGKLKIELRSQWRIDEVDYDRGTLADVRAGKVDMAKIAARSWDTLGVHTLQPLMAPLLVDSLALEERVLRDEAAGRMLEGVKAAGVTGVGLLPGELRKPVTLDHPLLGPSDYRGQVIGIRPSALSAEALRALGAEPRGYRAGGPLDGLDGVELDLNTLGGNGYDEPANSITANVNLWPRVYTVVLGPAAERRLSQEHIDMLRRAATESVGPAIGRLSEEATLAMKGLCNRRFAAVRASGVDLAALRDAFAPVSAMIAESPGNRAALARIEAIKGEVAAPADTPAACETKTAAARAPGPKALHGTWAATISRDEFLAAGPNGTEPIDGNLGRHEITFDGTGHFRLVLDDGSEATGVYAVEGDRITIEPGGDTTTDMGNGEQWRYRWSVYRDRLSLGRIGGDKVNPTALTAKPFTRG